MSPPKTFLSGVIEGFYGRPWPHETRLAYIDYLSEAGLNTSLYCPKSDAILRKQWRLDWPQQQWRELVELAKAHHSRGLQWGVGLSPFELYRNYQRPEQEQLRRKVGYIGELGPSLLAVLFDDMPGDIDALARRQAEIVSDISGWLPEVRVIVCPTYYSFDPVLPQYFGAMPQSYWPELGVELPSDVEIFWTGNEVCSKEIAKADIEAINVQLGRSVTLWDNYPVNDGVQRSNFLYTSKLPGREPSIKPSLAGHLCNPMNQGVLSLPALSGLAEMYGSGAYTQETLARFLGSQTWKCLSRDGGIFEQEGLSGMGEAKCRQLAESYSVLPGAAAAEITGWLQGEYQFDPACLTG
ncbi:MAG: hyaluronoglucosaminidase [Halioglobus sp.]|jgi:hyaluronoglucosaminidase